MLSSNTNIYPAEGILQCLFLLIVFVIIYDIYLYTNDIKGDTISKIISNWTYNNYFVFSFSWGVLAGHFFLGHSHQIISNDLHEVLFIAGLVITMGLIGHYKKIKTKPYHHVFLLAIGGVIGHYCWIIN